MDSQDDSSNTESTDKQILLVESTVPESNLGGVVRFSAPAQTGPEVQPACCTMDIGSLSGEVQRPGRGVEHLLLFRVEVPVRRADDLTTYFFCV